MRWARTLAFYRHPRTPNYFVRAYAVKAPASMTEGEMHIFNMLNDKLDPATLVVQDISGMYSLSFPENLQIYGKF